MWTRNDGLVHDLHACYWPNKPVLDLTRQGLGYPSYRRARLGKSEATRQSTRRPDYLNFSFIHLDTSIMHVTVACLSQNAVTPVAVVGESAQES